MNRLVIIILVSTLLSSCQKDFSEDILGTWTPVMSDLTNCNDETLNKTLFFDVNGCIEEGMILACQVWEFLDNGIIIVKRSISNNGQTIDTIEEATYSLVGATAIDLDSLSAKVSINDNKMTLSFTDSDCDVVLEFFRN